MDGYLGSALCEEQSKIKTCPEEMTVNQEK
jgi:hypothetical protein